MPGLLPLIFQGASLGFSACFSPGPLFMYLITQSLLGGWKRGALVALAPLVSDIPLVIIILLLLNQIPASFLRIVNLLGGLYVVYLAWNLFQSWRSPPSHQQVMAHGASGSLLRAVVVNYSSPGPYLFWTLVNGPLLLSALRTSILHGIVFWVSFYAVFIGGMLSLAGIFSQARRLPPRLVRLLAFASVVILCSLGFILIYRGITAEF